MIDVTGWQSAKPHRLGGRREKLHVWNDKTGEAYIWKEPAAGTGEHWMEKAASEIGQTCGLRIIEVELARRGEKLGVLVREFERRGDHEAGVVLLSETLQDYSTQLHHTYQRIRRILQPRGQMPAFHQMIVLDALIVNIDRHDENWELMGNRDRLTPIFDNGNCEIVHIPVGEQEKLLNDPDGRLGRFEDGVNSAIGWEEEEGDPYFPSPLRLLGALRQVYPEEFEAAVHPFLQVPVANLQRIFDRIPDEFIAPPCRELAKVMIAERMARLRELAR